MKVTTIIILSLFFLVGCSHNRPKKNLPGVPLVYIGFDNQIVSNGVLDVYFFGNDNRVYMDGIKGRAIDFSAMQQNKRPLLITFPDQYNPADYEGFTFLFWLKRNGVISDSSVVVADCHFLDHSRFRGWRLLALPLNVYRWEMSDGATVWSYQWQGKEAGLVKGWSQWGFQYHKMAKEVSFYLNGHKHSVIDVNAMDSLYFSGVLELGGSLQERNFSQHLFNGGIDGLGFWGRPLAASEIEAILESESRKKMAHVHHKNPFKVLTLSGGGLEAMPELWASAAAAISDIDAGVVLLQGANGFGHFLAQHSHSNVYIRGSGFCIVSKYPLGKTYRSVRDKHAAVIEVLPKPEKPIAIVSCYLNRYPLVDALFREKGVDVYAFLNDEQKKRGIELKLILGALSLVSKSQSAMPMVMGIDLNSGSHLDWTERNKLIHNGLMVPFGLSLLLQHDGFVDSYRQYYPDEALFKGFNAKRGGSQRYNHRQSVLYYKGGGLKLLESKVLSVMPEEMLGAALAVVSEFEYDD
jgi:hypothetical protein